MSGILVWHVLGQHVVALLCAAFEVDFLASVVMWFDPFSAFSPPDIIVDYSISIPQKSHHITPFVGTGTTDAGNILCCSMYLRTMQLCWSLLHAISSAILGHEEFPIQGSC